MLNLFQHPLEILKQVQDDKNKDGLRKAFNSETSELKAQALYKKGRKIPNVFKAVNWPEKFCGWFSALRQEEKIK